MVWNSLTWLVQVVVFPGFLTLIALALFYEWVDRKFVAKLQNRYGPLHVGPHGLLQPIADLIKLLSKEDITPFAADRVIFAASPLILLASPLTALLFIPMSGVYSTVGFEGDLLLVLFLFMLPMIAIFLGSWASANRFTAVGAVRATLQLLAYEVPMGMAAIGTAIAARSLSISRIVAWQAGSGVWLAV
ncbi:MAG: NADH-quinone oxidoreductase subunit H, partial [Thermoprotei archaeon]